mmetsp:Transcript_13091/g.25013  ORF Transcript_13091/g.25013 Transcript_13091/m.25013 type:complete len:249 (-) Transcript_13091:1797-2543(-)
MLLLGAQNRPNWLDWGHALLERSHIRSYLLIGLAGLHILRLVVHSILLPILEEVLVILLELQRLLHKIGAHLSDLLLHHQQFDVFWHPFNVSDAHTWLPASGRFGILVEVAVGRAVPSRVLLLARGLLPSTRGGCGCVPGHGSGGGARRGAALVVVAEGQRPPRLVAGQLLQGLAVLAEPVLALPLLPLVQEHAAAVVELHHRHGDSVLQPARAQHEVLDGILHLGHVTEVEKHLLDHPRRRRLALGP